MENKETVECAYCGKDVLREEAKLSLTQYVQGFYHLKCYCEVFGHLYTDKEQYNKIFGSLIPKKELF